MTSKYTIFTIQGEQGPFTAQELQKRVDAGEYPMSTRAKEVDTGEQHELSTICVSAMPFDAPKRPTSGSAQPPSRAAPVRETPSRAAQASRFPSNSGSNRSTNTTKSTSWLRVGKLCAIPIGIALALVWSATGPAATALADDASIVGTWDVALTEFGLERAGVDGARAMPGVTPQEIVEVLRRCRVLYAFDREGRFELTLESRGQILSGGVGRYELTNRWGPRHLSLYYDNGISEGWECTPRPDGSVTMNLDGQILGTMKPDTASERR